MSNIFINELRSIRQFAYILITMNAIGRRTGPEEISVWCGASEKTIKKGLKHLEISGHVHRVAYQNGWLITSKGQLFLSPNTEILPVSSTTTSYLNSNDKKDINLEVVQNMENLPVCSPEIHYPKYLALKACGIGEPKLSQLARLDISLDYVEAHIRQWRSQKQPPGLLIHRLEARDPSPGSQGEFDDFVIK